LRALKLAITVGAGEAPSPSKNVNRRDLAKRTVEVDVVIVCDKSCDELARFIE
jgi:hypothetical protein